MKDYSAAVEFLAGGRNKDDRPYYNNTRIMRRGEDSIAMRLHQTDVVTFFEDGRLTLHSGGWKTRTTSERMNRALKPRGWTLYSSAGVWRLWNRETDASVVYRDGMTLHLDGSVTGEAPESEEQRLRKLKRGAAEYAKLYVQALRQGRVPLPSAGDCWHCALREQKSGKTLGEAADSQGHVLGHIEECYFVPSLLTRAMEQFGMSPAGQSLAFGHMTLATEGGDEGERERAQKAVDGWGNMGFLYGQLQKAVKRYTMRQLGLAT